MLYLIRDNDIRRPVASSEIVTEFLAALIVAHRSDIPLVSLNHFTPFTRSIHQPSRHNPAPLSHSALQRAKVTPAETLRMTAYQPIQQLPGRGVRLALKPVQYFAPHSFEWIRMRPPRARLSRLLRFRLVRRTHFALSPQIGKPAEELLQTLTSRCAHRSGDVRCAASNGIEHAQA